MTLPPLITGTCGEGQDGVRSVCRARVIRFPERTITTTIDCVACSNCLSDFALGQAIKKETEPLSVLVRL